MATNGAPPPDKYGLGSPVMLEKIDKLFECGVGELVDLPQIVVVGDQSCGKSSVLEGLIKKPLPRDSGLCTRFATQIVFRRSVREGIYVSIIPERSASLEHSTRLKKWGKSVASLDSKAFADIMQEVHDVMGLSKGNGDATDGGQRKPTFSNDVLRLEISGPEQEHLGVIDVPGIFKSTTEGMTTKADILLVRNMVKGYMDNPRSVMLAVIPANVDVATQEILELAAEADPSQDRTLGVLTKPDLVDRGAESRVIELLEGSARPMKLGWHMIRNPGQLEMADKSLDRDTLETDFFRTRVPWKDIDKEKVGISSLRERLKETLSSLVKREFPKVKIEIRSRLDDRQRRLNDLGPERGGFGDRMAYLTNMAVRFQRLALNANHGADSVFDKEDALRISPAVMLRMKAFSDEMARFGETYSFLRRDDGDDSVDVSMALDEDPEPQAKKAKTSTPKQPFDTRKQEDIEALQDVLHSSVSCQPPIQGKIKDWLFEVFQGNRGFELGTFNSSILATVMKKQSSKWMDISMGFISDVVVMVHHFITTALECICTDDEIRRSLVNALFDDLITRYKTALENTKFLLEVENGDTPMTMNHYFNDNLQKSRQEKVVTSLKKSAFHVMQGTVVKLEQAIHTNNMSNDDHTIMEIHDILKSYYKVSRKTFVDNVCKQATLYYLLHPDKGPLALFSPLFVSQLSPTQLEEIAGEAPALKRRRMQLTKEIKSLTDAMKILARA